MAKKKDAPKAKEPKKPKDPSKKRGLPFDTTKVKEFLIAKGERVGLVVAAALMLLLLLSGMSMGLGTRSQYPEVKQTAQQLISRVNSGTGPDLKRIKPMNPPPWLASLPGQFPVTGWFDPGQIRDDRVYNPEALTVLASLDGAEGSKPAMECDVLRAPVKVYKIEDDKVVTVESGTAPAGTEPGAPGKMVGAGGVHLANYVEAKRLMVVSALFPYQKQLELYQKALRKQSVQEVLADNSLTPKFAGLNVIRCELEDGIAVNWTKIFFKDPDPKSKAPVEMQPEWKNFMTVAKFDRSAYQRFAKYVEKGLVTPMPELAKGEYPPPDLPGLKIDEPSKDKKSGTQMPGQKMPGANKDKDKKPGSGGKLESISLDDLSKSNKTLAKQLRGKFNAFNPYMDKTSVKKMPGKGPMAGDPKGQFSPKPPPGDDVKSRDDDEDDDDDNPKKAPSPPAKTNVAVDAPEYLLMRFVDVTVEPGKTYQYYIQVRLKNPNFEKEDEVAIPDEAKIKELVSDWAVTPAWTVDDDYRFYVVDQFYLDPPNMVHPGTKDTALTTTRNDRQVAVQIHRWIEKAILGVGDPTPQGLGLWAVAERMLAQRGQYLGRPEVIVPLPYWKETLERFEAPSRVNNKEHKFDGGRTKIWEFSGLKVDMQPAEKRLLVVDFKGGAKDYWEQTPNGESLQDKTAVHMLVLSPDGKLLSFNIRDDSDAETPRGWERAMQLNQWQSLILPDQQETMSANQQQKMGSRPPGGGMGGMGGKGGMGGMGGMGKGGMGKGGMGKGGR